MGEPKISILSSNYFPQAVLCCGEGLIIQHIVLVAFGYLRPQFEKSCGAITKQQPFFCALAIRHNTNRMQSYW